MSALYGEVQGPMLQCRSFATVRTIKNLNVKVISPSYPGHGGSDAQPFRSLASWPKDDVEPFLHAENEDSFIVQGTSY